LRVQAAAPAVPAAQALYQGEQSLYAPFSRSIADSFTKDYGIEEFIYEITANQGARSTGGKWTRPDITLVAVRIYPFIPGKTLELISFEVKPLYQYGVEAVYETAAHSIFANRSYLAIHIPSADYQTDVFDRLDRECERFRVGFLTFTDPADWDSFDIRIEAEHSVPDPAETSSFIKTQITVPNQTKIERLIR
jgi:hypothetical protein